MPLDHLRARGFATSASLRFVAVRRWVKRWLSDPAGLTSAGLVGTILIAASSFWVGATPDYLRSRSLTLVSIMHPQAFPARLMFYAGLLLLAGAWLRIGNLLLNQVPSVTWRAVRRAGLIWTTPLLLSAPLASRDLWAYAAQGNISWLHMDPYAVGPGAISDTFSAQVSPKWLNTPSPYGPLWLAISRLTRSLCGEHLLTNVGALRLFIALGVPMFAYSLPRLAVRFGGRPEVALWAVLANPLFIVDQVGGGHNDLLMGGLISLSLLAASGDRSLIVSMAVGGGLLGLAADIKLPALIVVPFLVFLWPSRSEDPGDRRRIDGRSLLAGICVAGASCVVVMALVNVVSGYGLGWLRQGSGGQHGGGILGLTLMAIAVVVCWKLANAWNPLICLAAALSLVVFITPIAQPWYWCWPIAIGAVILVSRVPMLALAAASTALLFVTRPNGQSSHLRLEVLVAAASLVTWLIMDRRWRPTRYQSSAGA